MVNCKDIKELLPPYLDDLMDSEKRKILEEHLSICSQCSRELADLKKAMRMLHEVDEVDPPPWFKQQIMARVRQEAAAIQDAGFLKRLFFPLHIKIPVQALAMVIVGIIALYLYKAAGPQATRVLPVNSSNVISEQPSISVKGNISSPKGSDGKQTGILSGKTVPEKQAQQKTAVSEIKTGKTIKEERGETKDEGLIRPKLPQENSQQLTAATSPVLPQMAEKGLNPVITLITDDASSASKEIERLLSNSGARIIERQYSDIRETINFEIEHNRINNLIESVKTLGLAEIKDMPTGSTKKKIILRLDIIEKKD
jgi:hypothetical protein